MWEAERSMELGLRDRQKLRFESPRRSTMYVKTLNLEIGT